MSWNDDDGWVYTEMSPALLDQMLDKNSFLIDKTDRMIAWHAAQNKYWARQFAIAEARAVMHYQGAVGKAKFAAVADEDVIAVATQWDIANAQLGLCERRGHALDKEAINLALRNKLLQATYNNGGGSY